MKNLICRSTVTGVIILASLIFANAAFAAITGVTRTGATQTNCAPSVGSPLTEGAQAYCDRTEPMYTYTGLHELFLEGNTDYVIVSVEDRTLPDYGLEVTVSHTGYLFLFIQDGLDVATYMPWVVTDGYGLTNIDVTLDKQGAFPNLTMNVWFRPVSPGEVELGPVATGPQAEPGTGSMYAVAYYTEQVDVGVSISDSPDPVLAGSGEGNFTLTVTAENFSQNTANNIEIDISALGLDDTVEYSVQYPAGTEFSGGTWTIPSMTEGSHPDLVLTYTVGHQQTSGADVVTWTAEVTALDEEDTNPDNDTATEATSVTDAASQSVSFNTSIDFLDDNEGVVTVTLTCNAGLPLSQTFDISEAGGVNFAMTNLPFTTPGTMCEITMEGLAGEYESTASANGAAVADSCVFVAGTAETGQALFNTSGANTCAFVASAGLASYTVSVDWMLDDPNIEEADYSVEITATCDANILTVNGSVVAPSMQYVGPLDDGDSVVLGVDVTTGAAECSAEQSVTQSGVESEASDGCTDAELTAGGSAECVFTNTVFFEGIPTLSQYGMALMALLMLGVGFVGFRRFV